MCEVREDSSSFGESYYRIQHIYEQVHMYLKQVHMGHGLEQVCYSLSFAQATAPYNYVRRKSQKSKTIHVHIPFCTAAPHLHHVPTRASGAARFIDVCRPPAKRTRRTDRAH